MINKEFGEIALIALLSHGINVFNSRSFKTVEVLARDCGGCSQERIARFPGFEISRRVRRRSG